MSVVWLIVIACGACWLVGMAMGVALANAGARGDRRGGMLEFTITGNTTATAPWPQSAPSGVVKRISSYTEPEGKSAA